RIVAALDNSLATGPVTATALALADLFGAVPALVHVQGGGDRLARESAQAVDLPLETLAGPVVERLRERAREDDVAALVIGARGTPGGRRPLGSTALAVATSLDKPVVVVPPHARSRAPRRRPRARARA